MTERRQLWPQKWDAALAARWSSMDSAPHDRPVLLLFSGTSGLAGYILAEYDADNTKGNEWRVPHCDAWFESTLFAGWRDPV